MQNISSLAELFKRDTKGKVRTWTIQVGWDSDDVAGIRTISGLVEGKKITSEWNYTEAKNVGRSNATTAKTQADAEALAQWTKNVEKDFFEDVTKIDTFTAFKPMLAHDFTKTPVTSGITQPKLDGIRCIASAKGLFSRQFKEIVAVPHIAEALADFTAKYPTVTLDGELYNHELKDNFQKITSLVRKTVNIGADELAEAKELVQYHVYDMFDSSNPDMTFMERYNWLQKNLTDTGPSIVKVVTHIAETSEDIDMLYGSYTEAGYEGQMIRQNTPYEFKRTKNLLKRKEFITEEYEVVEVHEGQGNWAGYAKRLTLKMSDGRTFSSGIRGSQAKLKELLENPDINWATCRYFELSNDGVPRFPVTIDYGKGQRED
jgi:ATP-dependent DNA ligase